MRPTAATLRRLVSIGQRSSSKGASQTLMPTAFCRRKLASTCQIAGQQRSANLMPFLKGDPNERPRHEWSLHECGHRAMAALVCGPLTESLLVGAFLQLLHHFVEVETRRLLALRIVSKRRQELADVVLRRDQKKDVIQQPIVARVRGNVCPFVGISAEVEDLRDAQCRERLRPDGKSSSSPLLQEYDFPVVVPQGSQLLVVVNVEERVARALRNLSRQVWQEIVAIEVDLVRHVADLVALCQFVFHVRVAGGR